jgi:hypothetical protein
MDTKVEIFNKDRAYYIHDHIVELSTQFRNEQSKDDNIKATKTQFVKYLEAMEPSPHNGVVVTYDKSSNKQKIGRLFAQGPSLQGMIREIRDTILTYDDGSDMTYDIDIVNCHPVLLQALMATRNVPHEMLGQYNSNREEKLHELMTATGVTRDGAKTLVLKVINGGSIGSNPTPWLVLLERELANIQHELLVEYDELTKDVRMRKKKANKSC